MDSVVTTATTRPPLVRPRDAQVGGVCRALAVHFGARVGKVRFVMVLLALAGGAGALFYLWLWALVPLTPARGDEPVGVRHRAPIVIVLGVMCAGAAAIAILAFLGGHQGEAIRPLVALALLASATVAWSLVVDRDDPGRSPRYRAASTGGITALLVLTGAIALTSNPLPVNAVLAIGLIVLGAGVIVVPRIVALSGDLMNERTARVREVQRAEIAAHLHDSVLQTLALIQNRAGASSEVARIARAQERELRDWLFAGDEPTAMDLGTQLRDIAAAIELDHAARIDIVTVGEPVEAAGALVAAAREAMLNAARHAGGDVSVYVETSRSSIDVFVRDRGPGVLLADIPDDRLGIRESIIGRMTRAGGTAVMRPGVGGSGTEVHLHLEAS